jgi:hypothetical protein
MADESRTTGMGLWTDANEMLAAAKHLASIKKFELSQPLYYLLGHSLELSFKCYVRAKGATLGCLRSIGHDLELGLDWALTAGLGDIVQITAKDRGVIALMNRYYKAKEFEYRVTGSKRYPLVADLIELIERVLKATKPVCRKSV